MGEGEETQLGERERMLLHFDKNFKSLRQVAMARVNSIFSHFIDQDLHPFARRFVSISAN